jgi:TldD protein
MVTPELCKEILHAALGGGGERADLFAERTRTTSVRLEGGRIEEATGGTDQGVGISVHKADQVLFANSNRIDREGLLDMARRLSQAVGKERKSRCRNLEPVAHGIISPVVIAPASLQTPRKIEILKRADEAARGEDGRISHVTCSYSDAEQEVWAADSEGLFSADLRTMVTLSVVTVARDRERITTGIEAASQCRGFELFDIHTPERVGRESAMQAILQLAAEPAPAGTFTVVLSSSAGGTMIHEACGHGLEADFIDKGMSVYAGKLGKKVASELITVVDDGTLPNKRGSSAIDDEGAPTSRVLLIEKGILKGFLHSRKTARQFNVAPTGNGRRESYRNLPIPRMRNTMILPGESDAGEILAGVTDGIFVKKMGGGEVDVATGNFVFSCSEAYRVRDGKIQEPIRDATLIGNGPEVLTTIDAVGSDLGFGVGTCGKEGQGVPVSDAQPTIRIPKIVVGGVGETPGQSAKGDA